MKKLSDRIWETSKTRIYAERRLVEQATTTELLLIWYSLFLVAASIWLLCAPAKSPAYLTVVGSIAVLVASVYLSARNFRSRAVQIRNNYVSLATLVSRARAAENAGDEEELRRVEEAYGDKLVAVENHTEYDYLCLRYSRRRDKDTTLPPLQLGDWAAFMWARLWRYGLVLALTALPLLLAWALAHIGDSLP